MDCENNALVNEILKTLYVRYFDFIDDDCPGNRLHDNEDAEIHFGYTAIRLGSLKATFIKSNECLTEIRFKKFN